jgi:hypothetical protein
MATSVSEELIMEVIRSSETSVTMSSIAHDPQIVPSTLQPHNMFPQEQSS